MQMNITQASRIAGVDRTTIQRKVRQGLISSTLDAQGRPKIALSELLRLYPDIQQDNIEVSRSKPQSNTEVSHSDALVHALKDQITLLQQQVGFLQEQIQAKDEQLQRAFEIAEGLKKIESTTSRKSRVKDIVDKVFN